jgi:hypothetical protein
MTGPACRSPVTDVVDFFARGPSREAVAAFRLSSAARETIRSLLEKNAAGTCTSEEERQLDQMVLLDGILSLIRARASSCSVSNDDV